MELSEQIKAYALEQADEERDQISSYNLSSCYKTLAQSHIIVLAPKSQLP